MAHRSLAFNISGVEGMFSLPISILPLSQWRAQAHPAALPAPRNLGVPFNCSPLPLHLNQVILKFCPSPPVSSQFCSLLSIPTVNISVQPSTTCHLNCCNSAGCGFICQHPLLDYKCLNDAVLSTELSPESDTQYMPNKWFMLPVIRRSQWETDTDLHPSAGPLRWVRSPTSRNEGTSAISIHLQYKGQHLFCCDWMTKEYIFWD